ncbi:hypothetical protein [Aestuariirhabdus litorea]|uniref:Uncharacterized protein n=1 Tax=Aestuariirhabdus litorea TaxID=2528527 RepID=A0A3P3VPS9_9GAMM|nr:hypothetical protein [Aestuariirhabdus litorea]RRJ84327.1 hypothetical protein D0544_04250 [Aestuariirhabdus litorea]RWW97550.1 hypothetical protein DZC74_04250 [Endozoicomonadaceae bacterium GTF-13]
MNRETGWAIAIVAGVLLLIGVVLWWFSADTSDPLQPLPPQGAQEAVSESLAPASPETAPAPVTPTSGAAATASPNSQDAGQAAVADEGAMETIRIIVREPVTVDGVDVGQALKGKVIINEDQVVDRPASQ